MPDEQVPDTGPEQDARGPLVAPGLVPAIERPVGRRRAPLWQSVGVALLVLGSLALLVLGVVRAGERWGDAAQAMTAAEAFKYLVAGDADAFLALVEPEVRARVDRAGILANAESNDQLEWAGPAFSDGAARLVVRRTTSQAESDAPGTAVFTPDPERGDLVRMTASGGPFGEASGTIQLTRTIEGWRVTGYRFTSLVEPTGTPAAK